MPKPKTKKELIEQSQVSYQKLLELVNSYPKEIVEKEFPKGTLNRNIKDVLSHLHHWHLMMIGWYTVGMKGEQPAMPAKGYTWQTLPALNQKIWEDCQDIKLERAKELLAESFQKAQHIIKENSEEALFEKKRFKWTGTTSLAAYLILNTCSHYNWAIKLIKKSMK